MLCQNTGGPAHERAICTAAAATCAAQTARAAGPGVFVALCQTVPARFAFGATGQTLPRLDGGVQNPLLSQLSGQSTVAG